MIRFTKKRKILLIIVFLVLLGFTCQFFLENPKLLNFENNPKNILINDNGLLFQSKTTASNVDTMLKEKGLSLSEYDLIIPEKNSTIFPGMNILIRRALPIQIIADGETKEFFTLTNTVRDAIIDSQIALGEDDLVSPKIDSPLKKDLEISITRVEIAEETIKKAIDFKTISKEDDELGWRIKKVEQKGEKGSKEIKYKVVRHDGKEISRKALEERIVKEPTPEIVVQGTFMKLGKDSRGQATWYAFKGGMFAASTTLPRGAFAKVTSLASGKSIVVQINDYGPQGKGRIIDLDKVAFEKLAPLGAGVIGVKVEQVLN